MANILYRGAAVPSGFNTAGTNDAPLTNDQIDKNLYALNTDKLDKEALTAQTVKSDVTFSGNVTINGTTTTINTTDLALVDKNIELGKVTSPTDGTANGGGITLKGNGDKTITWDSTNVNWTSSENWNIATGKVFKINNVSVLSNTTLGANVVNSSLTKLGTGAGFVKSDASGSLTVDTSTYSVTSHGHFVGTTAVQASSVNQALTGITSITGGTGTTNITLSTSGNAGATGALSITTGAATAAGDAGAISIAAGAGFGAGDGGAINITAGAGGASANGNGGNIGIITGSGTTLSGTLSIATGTAVGAGNINIKPGTASNAAIDFAGGVTISGGNTTGSGPSINAGNVSISGGSNTAVAGVGGNVAIEGGAGVTTKGSVTIGSGSNTAAIGIGSSTNTTTVNGTVKLANVGTSGFVKLGAGGQLSADTTTYLSGTVAIASGGTNITSYTAGDILYASSANVLSKLVKGTDGQVLKLASGMPAWGTDNDTDTTYLVITEAEITAGTATTLRTISGARAKFIADRNVGTATPLAHGTAAVGTSLLYARQDHVHASDNTDTITRLRGTTSGTFTSGDLTLLAGTNVSITQSGSSYTINSTYVDTNTNTTYSHEASAGTGGANLDLVAGGSGSGTDSVLFKSGGATTVTRTDANTITISSTDTDTTYALITEAEITTGTATDLRTISGARAKYIAERNKSDTAPSAHGTAAIGTSLKYARQDHVHASDNTDTITRLRGTASGTFTSGDLTLAAGSNVTVTQSGSTYTIASSYTDTDTNTTYSHAAAAGTGGANLSLIAGGSGSGTDNVLFKSGGATTVSHTDADTITISSTDTTYALITAAEITAGTATDLRTISGTTAKLIADRNVGTATPQAHGTAAVGTSLLYARQDHVHASDNTDTTYSLITEAEITAGTATDLRTISGARAKFIADRNAGDTTAKAHGTAAIGTSLKYARQDHVHPSDNTDTTYSNGTGLALTGTVFSVNYGTTSTTACVGNDTRLSNAREANGGTATNANNVYVTQTDNTTNYDYSLLLTAGAAQNISLRADITGGPTYNPLRNALCLDGFASHIWTYPALQLGRDWSISQDAYSYSFAAGCKASSASAWTGTGNFSKAMRFSLDANAGTFYWYVKPSDTVDTTTSISFRTAMSLDIDGNLTTNGGLTATTGTFSGDITSEGTITSTSDIRVKTNITKIDNALAKVEQLNGYTFDRTDSVTPRQTGVIAQEVLKVLPEAVLGSEDTAYSVAYGNMMGLMIEAIKELNAKVLDLQNQLANK